VLGIFFITWRLHATAHVASADLFFSTISLDDLPAATNAAASATL